MTYRTFTRTWWEDDNCTVPGAGPKKFTHSTMHATENGARAACEKFDRDWFASKNNPNNRRGPRGLCMEYEEVR